MAIPRRRIGGKQRRPATPIQHVIIIGSLFIVIVYAIGFSMIIGKRNQPIAGAAGDLAMKNLANGSVSATGGDHEPPSIDKKLETPHVEKPIVKTASATIGWAVTITGCGSDPITEGAAVLMHAIHLTSVHGNMGGRYDYKMYAIYHPDGEACALTLKDLGYELVKRETPVAVKDIEGKFLREKIVRLPVQLIVIIVLNIELMFEFIVLSCCMVVWLVDFPKEKNGCCGEKELVKLEAYTLTDHPAVVHLDLDVVVLKPMDALFDMMLADSKEDMDTSNVPLMWPDLPIPEKVNAFFTRDCRYHRINWFSLFVSLVVVLTFLISLLKITWSAQVEHTNQYKAAFLFCVQI
jgi:hypothetical protein